MNDLDSLIKAIKAEKKKGKVLIAEIAPATRFAIGECFKDKVKDNTAKTVSMLKQLGFDSFN